MSELQGRGDLFSEGRKARRKKLKNPSQIVLPRRSVHDNLSKKDLDSWFKVP
jgi:hypothetical protein